jgi:hypothetical protein
MFPIIPGNSAAASFPENSEGIFGFGYTTTYVGMTNLVSDAGVVASDVSAVGTARGYLAGCEFGDDKGIFGFGYYAPTFAAMTNIVSNAGVVASDVAGVGTARHSLCACSYDEDKGVFVYGTYDHSNYSATRNLVSNLGVVATDAAASGTAREGAGATEYGGDKGIIAFGFTGGYEGWQNMSNLVSNTGVVATDTTGVGTTRGGMPGGCGFGGDTAIFAYGYFNKDGTGYTQNMSNLVSNTGVVATDTTGVGTVRTASACEYGDDKGIFGFGYKTPPGTVNQNVSNLVSNTGVIATDTSGVGTARRASTSCSFN